MRGFFYYLQSLIIIPIITIILMVLLDVFITIPFFLRVFGYILAFVLLMYLVPYFLRAFVWSLLPSYVFVLALERYVPSFTPANIGILPPSKEVLICNLILSGIIQLLTRNFFIKDDRGSRDYCVPFMDEDKNKRKASKGYVMARDKKRPIGFIWDEDEDE